MISWNCKSGILIFIDLVTVDLTLEASTFLPHILERALLISHENFLGVRLLKTKATTLSNWSRIPLTTSQINYAAYDAWAAVAILTILAKLDSSIFGANAIRQLLKDEPSIQDLHTPKRDSLKYFDISSLGGFQ